jgi:hypothetical protein
MNKVMNKITLHKIPSIFKNVNLPTQVYIDTKIAAEEGAFVVVQALENEGKKDVLEFCPGRLGALVEGDIIAGVLGYRCAPTEFAGYVPKQVKVGDELYLLVESGVIGEISGVYEAWGKPMKVKVLGAIVSEQGKQLNLNQYCLPKAKASQKKVPIIAFLATRMDSGKTTMAAKIAHALTLQGKKVAAIKATGVGYTQDLHKINDYGAFTALDFVDMGLPSTCGPAGENIVAVTEDLIATISLTEPDVILIEFGEGIIGEYHVKDILEHRSIKDQIAFLVLAANDFSGVFGTQKLLEEYGLPIDVVTGPVANSQIGVDLIQKYFQLEAESNQHQIPKTISMIEKKIAEEAIK